MVMSKFAAVNVGIALRPSAIEIQHTRQNLQVRSVAAQIRRIHQPGQVERLVEVDEESRARCCDLARDQVGRIAGAKRRQRVIVVVERLKHDDVHAILAGCSLAH